MAHNSWAGLATAVGLAVLAACSAAPAPAAPAAPPARSNSLACAALITFDAATTAYPGGDPTEPPPSADAVQKWAATAIAPLGDLAANVPAELDQTVATLGTAVAGAQSGTPINTDDPTVIGAATALDKWGRASCGFAKLDVTNTGAALSGIPATLSPGPLSITFVNGGPADKAAFVLLVAKVKDGAQYTLDGIRDGSVDFTSVSDIVSAAQPTKQEPTAFSTATLSKGTYLLVSPIGSPPQFADFLAGEFTVG